MFGMVSQMMGLQRFLNFTSKIFFHTLSVFDIVFHAPLTGLRQSAVGHAFQRAETVRTPPLKWWDLLMGWKWFSIGI